MREVWTDIENYESFYQVSNTGLVKSIDRYVENSQSKNNGKRFIKGKILNPTKSGAGYKSVMLSKDGKTRRFLIHILESKAFLPNPDNLPCVNHKDEDKTNNTIWINEDGSVDFEKSNLEWCTYQYNNTYGENTKIGRKKKRIPIMQMDLQGNELCLWFSGADCAAETGYKATSLTKCCKGKSKTYKGFRWKYAM